MCIRDSLTSDWHWNPYRLIAEELGRSVSCYTLFDKDDKFNSVSFEAALSDILKEQEETLVIVNTPAHLSLIHIFYAPEKAVESDGVISGYGSVSYTHL